MKPTTFGLMSFVHCQKKVHKGTEFNSAVLITVCYGFEVWLTLCRNYDCR